MTVMTDSENYVHTDSGVTPMEEDEYEEEEEDDSQSAEEQPAAALPAQAEPELDDVAADSLAPSAYLEERARFASRMTEDIDDVVLEACVATMADAVDSTGTPNGFIKAPTLKWYQSGDPAEKLHAPDHGLLTLYEILTHEVVSAKMVILGITPDSLTTSAQMALRPNFDIDREAPAAWITCYKDPATGATVSEPLRPLCMTMGMIMKGTAEGCCESRCRGLVTQGTKGRHSVRFDCLQPKCPSHCKQDYEKLPLDKWLYWEFFEFVQTIGQTPKDWKQWGSLVLTFAKPLKQLYLRQEYRRAQEDRQAKAARADGLKPSPSPAASGASAASRASGSKKRGGGVLEVGSLRRKARTTLSSSTGPSGTPQSTAPKEQRTSNKRAKLTPEEKARRRAALQKQMEALA